MRVFEEEGFKWVHSKDGKKYWLDATASPGSWDMFLKALAIVPLVMSFIIMGMAIIGTENTLQARIFLFITGFILFLFGGAQTTALIIVESGKAGRYLIIGDEYIVIQYGLIFDPEEKKIKIPLNKIQNVLVVEEKRKDRQREYEVYVLKIIVDGEEYEIWEFREKDRAESLKNMLLRKIKHN